MTLNLDLTPQAEAWLKAEAQQRGLQLVDFAQRVLEERAITSTVPPSRQTPQERIRALDDLAEKHADRPIVTESAFDRANIYEDKR